MERVFPGPENSSDTPNQTPLLTVRALDRAEALQRVVTGAHTMM